MLPPGLSDAWVMRTSMSVGALMVGVTRSGERVRTLEGTPAAICVHARILAGNVEVILAIEASLDV